MGKHNRARNGYQVDTSLTPKIRQYLEEHPDVRVDADVITDYLRSSFPSYQRLNRNALRSSVLKCMHLKVGLYNICSVIAFGA